MELPALMPSPREMYQVLHPRNTIETSSPREYVDVREIIRQRKEANKAQKSSIYETKKGYYWDKAMKEQSFKPGANIYNVETTLLNKSKSQLEKKVDMSLIKHSYLESIELEEKKRPKPGPSSYSLNTSISSLSKSKGVVNGKQAKKPLFLSQFEASSNDVPGPGSYNPREISPKAKPEHFDPSKYRQMHKKQQQQLRKKHTTLSPNSYHAIVRGTFDEVPTRKVNKSVHVWGTGERFPYNIKQLSKVRMPNPLPDRYDLSIDWGHQKKKKNWIQSISRSSMSNGNIYN